MDYLPAGHFFDCGLAFDRRFAYNPSVDNNAGSDEYRKLPSVDELLRDQRAARLLEAFPREAVVDGIRGALAGARAAIEGGASAPECQTLLDSATAIARRQSQPSLRRAINGTGIIVHTGLGRAVLGKEAQAAVAEVAAGHSTLEIDTESGKRGSRQAHVSGLLTSITGAEAALVVNNNAAAVLLAVNTLAQGREVIISRGQLVEIGGSFRLPDIIRRAGARLVEVGTTNRTRLSDYEDAITDDTALILRCHPSNFKIAGYTEEVPLEDLVALGKHAWATIPVIDDLGSGAFVDLSVYGLEREPTVQDSVKAGAELVGFSGDKLLGASQAGILVGSAESIERCRSNPLARALRADKLTLAALEATLRVYRYGDPASDVPVLAAVARSVADIEAQTAGLCSEINALGVPGLRASVETVTSETGGGSLPGQSLESRAVGLKSDTLSAEDLSKHLRENNPPIFGRIVKDVFLLDMRTVAPHEVVEIVGCVRSLTD